MVPVHLQNLQLPLAECLEPFRFPPEACHYFINAICNGEGFTIDIRHERLPRFDSEDFDERQIQHLLINVEHLLISHHDIGLNHASIVRREYSAKKANWPGAAAQVKMQYLVSVIFPKGGPGVPGSIRCSPRPAG